EPHFRAKWKHTKDEIRRIIPEETYPQWDKLLGDSRPDISNDWLSWKHSIIGIDYGKRPTDGESRTLHFMHNDYKTEFKKVTSI
ncbi:MAG: hypothetical protein ACW98W_13735, partial [Candidatus Hodarchaeales archaeon]